MIPTRTLSIPPAWLSSNPVSRIAHAIATPQHHYTRIQHVNICTLSDKPCVMLSLYMSTFFFMILFCISTRLWYRVHCTNNTVSYGLDFGPENESVCCSRNQMKLGSYHMVYIGSSNMINPGVRTTRLSNARKSIVIIHAFDTDAFVDTSFKPLPSEYLYSITHRCTAPTNAHATHQSRQRQPHGPNTPEPESHSLENLDRCSARLCPVMVVYITSTSK